MVRAILLMLICVACSAPTTSDVAGLPHGIAVINSDYRSTTVSLLDPNSLAVHAHCVDSGSVAARLSMALSGDVVLPSQPAPDGTLVLLDRSNAALLWIDPSVCRPLRQLAVGHGFAANPHDVLTLSAHQAYVTRFDPNMRPSDTPSAYDSGNDVLRIDPTTATVLGTLALQAWSTPAADATPTLARPDRAVLAADRVFISLGSLSVDYGRAGPGRVVMIDPATDAVVGTLDIPELVGCSGLAVDAAQSMLAVGCDGIMTDPHGQAHGSGVVIYDLHTTPPQRLQTILASDLDNQPVLSASLAISAQTVVFVTLGSTDTLREITITTGAARTLFSGSQANSLSSALLHPDTARLSVSDANATSPCLRVFDAGTQSASVVSDPSTGLPPRQLGWF